MKIIFEVKDKTERKIYLSAKRWKHITSSSSPHAYMTNFLEEIKQTLIKPDKIVNSVYEENKVNYYKYYKNRKQYLRVIVNYLNNEGDIITSYFVRNIVK